MSIIYIFIIFLSLTGENIPHYRIETTEVKDSLNRKDIINIDDIQSIYPLCVFSANGIGSVDITGAGSSRSTIFFNGVKMNLPQNNHYSLLNIPLLLADAIVVYRNDGLFSKYGGGMAEIETSNDVIYKMLFKEDYGKFMRMTIPLQVNTNISIGTEEVSNHYNYHDNIRIYNPNNWRHNYYFMFSNSIFPVLYFSEIKYGIPSSSMEILYTSYVKRKEYLGSFDKYNVKIDIHYTDEWFKKDEGMYFYNNNYKNTYFNMQYYWKTSFADIIPYFTFEQTDGNVIKNKQRIVWGSKYLMSFYKCLLDIDISVEDKTILPPSFGLKYNSSYTIDIAFFHNMPSFNDLYWPQTIYAQGDSLLFAENGVSFDMKKGWKNYNLEIYASFWYNGIIWYEEDGIWRPHNESFFYIFSPTLFYKNKYLDLFANLNIVRNDNFYLPYKPLYNIGGRFKKETDFFFYGVKGFLKGKMYLNTANTDYSSAYWIINPFIGFDYKEYKIEFFIYNLFNTRYEEFYGYPGQGRELSLQISLKKRRFE